MLPGFVAVIAIYRGVSVDGLDGGAAMGLASYTFSGPCGSSKKEQDMSSFVPKQPSSKAVRTAVEDTVDILAENRKSRRKFLGNVGAGALSAAALSATGGVMVGGSAAQAQTVNDAAVLNFALNLEYLEAEFYTLAVSGNLINEAPYNIAITGTTSGSNPAGGGTVTVKARTAGTPLVTGFTIGGTTAVQQYANEIAADERNHVIALRATLGNLGSAPAARPNIDLLNSFNAAGTAIGLGSFDPYGSPLAFLLGSFVFEDVGVTAYKGGSSLLRNRDVLTAAAGILAVEAYHSGSIRTLLFQQAGVEVTPGVTVADVAQRISNLRDSADGPDDLDQGVTTSQPTSLTATGAATGAANLIPTDVNSIAFSRTPAQVLGVVYLGGAVGTGGGFFPSGLNGAVR